MAELKTKKTKSSVKDFLNKIPDETKRKDCIKINDIMKKITKAEPKMWGAAIVGFGDFHYKYASGREGDFFITGFSPRKEAITLYFMSGLHEQVELLKKLGKHKTGKGCLYIKKIEDVDVKVLEKLISSSFKKMCY